MLTSFLFWEHSQDASGQAFIFIVSSVWDLLLSEICMSYSLLYSAFYWTITFSKKEDTPYGNCGLCQLRKVRTMFFRTLSLFFQVMVGHNSNVCKMWRPTWSSSHPNAVKTGLITRYGCKFINCCWCTSSSHWCRVKSMHSGLSALGLNDWTTSYYFRHWEYNDE